MIFAPSLKFLAVHRQNVSYWPLSDFGVCFAKQRIQNHIEDIFGVFLCLTTLFVFFLKLAFELDKVTLK